MTEEKVTQQAKAPAVQPQMPTNESSSTAIVDEDGNTVIDTKPDIPDDQAVAEMTENEDGDDVVEISGGKLEKTIIISDPRWLNCPYGQVAVFGHHLISEKMLNLIGACLNLPDFNPDSGDKAVSPGVFSVVIVDHQLYDKAGNKAYGLFYDDARAVVMSVYAIFNDIIDIFAGENNSVSVVANIQLSMLEHTLHEICHAAEYAQGIDINTDAAEERATAFGASAVVDLVKMIDCEPVIAEEPYFGRMLMDLVEEMQPGEGEKMDPHVKQCIDMIQTGTMLYLPADKDNAEIRISSFKDFVKLVKKADSSDPAWNADSPRINYVVGGVETETSVDTTPLVTKPEDVAKAFPQQTPEGPEVLDEYSDTPDVPFTVDEGETDASVFSAPTNAHAAAPQAGFDISTLFPKPNDPVTPAGPNTPGVNTAPPQGQPAPQQQAPAFNAQSQPQAPAFGAQPQQQAPAPAPQPSLPQNGINEMEAQRLFILLAQTIDRVFFNHCGWNGQGAFSNPKAVTQQPLNLAAIDPKMPEFVIAADMDINGNYRSNRPTDGGMLYGNFKRNTNLPGYTVHLNVNGVMVSRALIPQNPATGSTWASQAQQGQQMTNIMDNDPNLRQARITDKMRAQVINGQFTPFQKG